jgi:2-keto-4-pentenoate hydratase/2-oxohepta-3-ene-1,7-dioic acid hydratase in catechol pathway
MKLASFRADERDAVGIVTDTGFVDLTARLGVPDLKTLIATEDLASVRDRFAGLSPDVALNAATWLPVVPNPGKILCIGLNYEKHRIETNSAKSDFPQVFGRWPDSLAAHESAMWHPKTSETFDYECELAVIIGKPGRRIPEAIALDHVAGYSCFNEGSVREWQRHTTQAVPGKNWPHTGGFGPWMVTSEDLGDPHTLEITTRLNGVVVQNDTTDSLIFNVPRLINYCSTFTPLSPGDVIVTGTPSGVGSRRTPPLWMKVGDMVEIEISRIGTLRNYIEYEPT